MENTGRITRTLDTRAQQILFNVNDTDVSAELDHISQVDLAHLLMLMECKVLDRRAIPLVRAIRELRSTNFAALCSRPMPRGIYLSYESYLSEKLGSNTGGILQTARSRNDLNATVFRLRLRSNYIRLARAALGLQTVLLQRARHFQLVVMPAFTHFQAAVPITYGHYLLGISTALDRDIRALIESASDLDHCPLGAGATGGSTLPINTARTAELLGFKRPVLHSVDAVASRDLVLRILAAASIMGITLSRLATDLLLWTTAEFQFLDLPDELIGSSSMMPQKRNPFLLEHVQGRAMSSFGAFVASASAMHNAPFSNSIAVGTEAVARLWPALQQSEEALLLARLVVAGANPNPSTMLRRADEGYTIATELANRIALSTGLSFREAHHLVGSSIREAIRKGGVPLEHVIVAALPAGLQKVEIGDIDPTTVAQTANYGGGPGPISFEEAFQLLRTSWAELVKTVQAQARLWRNANSRLETAVEALSKVEESGDIICEPAEDNKTVGSISYKEDSDASAI